MKFSICGIPITKTHALRIMRCVVQIGESALEDCINRNAPVYKITAACKYLQEQKNLLKQIKSKGAEK